MKQSILQNWNFIRLLRLLAGLAILAQAIWVKDAMFGIAGLIFTSMALFNIGCCSTVGCNTENETKYEKAKEITYEEVV